MTQWNRMMIKPWDVPPYTNRLIILLIKGCSCKGEHPKIRPYNNMTIGSRHSFSANPTMLHNELPTPEPKHELLNPENYKLQSRKPQKVKSNPKLYKPFQPHEPPNSETPKP